MAGTWHLIGCCSPASNLQSDRYDPSLRYLHELCDLLAPAIASWPQCWILETSWVLVLDFFATKISTNHVVIRPCLLPTRCSYGRRFVTEHVLILPWLLPIEYACGGRPACGSLRTVPVCVWASPWRGKSTEHVLIRPCLLPIEYTQGRRLTWVTL